MEPVLEGRIVDTSDGGGYTYLLVEKDGRSSWSAIPQRQVTIGQQVRLSAGITMVNFRSKALQHTFQEICFSPGIEETPPQSLDSSREAGVLVSKHHPLISDALPKAPLEPPNLPCGTVLESVRGGGFTYLLIANGSTTTWVAIPEAYVAPGSMVVTQQGLLLSSFTSTSLRRTFRDIVFSPGLVR